MAVSNCTGSKKRSERSSSRIRELDKKIEKLRNERSEVAGLEDGMEQLLISSGDFGPRDLEVKVDRLLRLKEVLQYIPVSKSTWWAGVKSGRYPASVKHLGPRITAWRLSQVMLVLKGEVKP